MRLLIQRRLYAFNLYIFAGKQVHPREVTGSRILEVGSYDVNGSIHQIWEIWDPSEYIGVENCHYLI